MSDVSPLMCTSVYATDAGRQHRCAYQLGHNGAHHSLDSEVRWPNRHDPDAVNHPPHYTAHPSGVECITVTEHYGFNVGNAIKYLWRAGIKSPDPLEDLKKAAWYVNREIARIEARNG